MDPRWIHPFTALVAGPTGCGKTVFVQRFLQHLPDMVDPGPEEIIWCYGEWQPLYNTLKGVQFVEGLPDVEQWKGDKRRLVIIDDLMSETDERVTKLFTKGSHHRDLSVMYVVQNLFGKNKEHRTISLNAHYIVIFKNPRDGSQITNLAKQMYPGRVSYLQESFKDATSAPHGYLLLDLRQETPDNLRLRTYIFPDEIQTVYVPK
jgi:GTPase SAR1 family protein